MSATPPAEYSWTVRTDARLEGVGRTVGFYWDPLFLDHDTGRGHPERPARVAAIRRRLEGDGLMDDLIALQCPEAPMAALAAVHSPDYLADIERLCAFGGGALDPDTRVSEASFTAARRASGAGLDAIERVTGGELDAAFVACRPPGHHARRASAMGFCIVNHVAVAAARLIANGERVAVVDWDAHHGNGTQEMFWADNRVLYVSTHQYPHYPMTGSARDVGEGAGAGFTLNIPLPAGAGPDDFLFAFGEAVVPAIDEFGATFLLLSAGYDAHRGDPLCDLAMTAPGYRRLAGDLGSLGLPVVAFLEGGYDLDDLSSSVHQTIEAWVSGDGGTHPGGGGVHDGVRAAVDAARALQRQALAADIDT
jgi:acetoin utilization deacetylase AcuC-like enzyme